jgi:transcriptional regulator with XRE-family HTH domain
MAFNEKLKLLMQVQGISNSKIARALSVDPSLISRWKSGSRVPPKNSAYFSKLVDYFIRHAEMDYQKSALAEVMGLTDIPDSDASLALCLEQWLLEEKPIAASQIDRFIARFLQSPSPNMAGTKEPHIPEQPSGRPFSGECYRGRDGFKSAILRFLTDVRRSEKKVTLLLYSDLPLKWLSEDPAFALQWAFALKAVALSGHKIKIIHTIQRDVGEMLFAVEQWLPMYMSGVIEPFYDPNFKRPLFNRTLFLAPGIASVTSTTFSSSLTAERYLYTRDTATIADYVEEFEHYLKKCLPLMHIFTAPDHLGALCDYQADHALSSLRHIVFSDSPSIETFPEAGLDYFQIDRHQKQHLYERLQAFKKQLDSTPYTEILHLDPSGKSKPRNFICGSLASYDEKCYRLHLQNLIFLLERYPNYMLYLVEDPVFSDLYLSYKEEGEILIIKNAPVPMAFGFDQPQMVHAFKLYLDQIIHTIPPAAKTRTAVIAKLKSML